MVLYWIAAFVLGYAVSAWARSLARKPEPKPALRPRACAHRYLPIDAQALKSDMLAHEATVLLQRCSECGEHRTAIFGGHWQIGDFLKERADIAELERMMR